MTTVAQDSSEIIDLGAMDFIFAIQALDPRVARISLTQTAWNFESGGKSKTKIPLVDCKDLLNSSSRELSKSQRVLAESLNN